MANQKENFVVIGGAREGSIGLTFIREQFTRGIENVAIFDICDPSVAIAQLKSEFPSKSVLFHQVDVRRRDEIESAFKSVVKTFGHVDVLANFAGILNESKPIDTIEINLFGVIHATLIAVDHMSVSKGGQGGTIINMGSVLGLDPISWGPFYCTAKFGVVGFTRCFAEPELESELGIKFIILCPGFTDTKLLPTDIESSGYGQNSKIIGEKCIDKYGIQTVDECVKNIVEVVQKSNNGDAWILSNGTHKKVNFHLYYKTD